MKKLKLRRIAGLTSIGLSTLTSIQCTHSENEKMNVLFIVVDDLNDWVGCFGGNPQVITPNIDMLAKNNSTVFLNAQAAATVCGPSRSALLTGLRPSTSGVYTNRQNLINSDTAAKVPTLPQYFSANGYLSISTGKIFHKHPLQEGRDQGEWAFDIWRQEKGMDRGINKAEKPLSGLPPYPIGGTYMDWGPTLDGKEKTKDWLSAQWISEKLNEDYEKPFFMMLGISKPHLTWYVPQEYFDLYDLDTINAPEFLENDLDDILTPEGKLRFEASEEFKVIRQENKMKDAARAYMACVSYADDCVGQALNALNNSKYANNTIVVLIGDHGWHLGEKLKYRKNNAWEEDCRAPLIIHVPGMKSSQKSHTVVSFMDLYPTLADLCGLPIPSHCDGQSLVPLLKNPSLKREPVLSTISYKNHSIRNERFRYIVYEDGTEELYDHSNDPMEWDNLIRDPEYTNVISELKTLLPETNAAPTPTDDEILGKEDNDE